jgi:uncharacterized protein YecT (DUF1311 family)
MKLLCTLLFIVSTAALIHPQDHPKHEEDACCCTTYDTNMCLSKVLDKLDGELTKTYEATLKHVGNPKQLKKSQEFWIAYRDAQCQAEADQYKGGTIAPQVQGFAARESRANVSQNLLQNISLVEPGRRSSLGVTSCHPPTTILTIAI